MATERVRAGSGGPTRRINSDYFRRKNTWNDLQWTIYRSYKGAVSLNSHWVNHPLNFVRRIRWIAPKPLSVWDEYRRKCSAWARIMGTSPKNPRTSKAPPNRLESGAQGIRSVPGSMDKTWEPTPGCEPVFKGNSLHPKHSHSQEVTKISRNPAPLQRREFHKKSALARPPKGTACEYGPESFLKERSPNSQNLRPSPLGQSG